MNKFKPLTESEIIARLDSDEMINLVAFQFYLFDVRSHLHKGYEMQSIKDTYETAWKLNFADFRSQGQRLSNLYGFNYVDEDEKYSYMCRLGLGQKAIIEWLLVFGDHIEIPGDPMLWRNTV